MSVTRLIAIVLFFAVANVASAQQALTLEQCVQRVLDESLALQRADLNVQQNEISLMTAEGARYPNLNGSANVGSNFGRTVDPTTNQFNTKAFAYNSYGLSSNVVLYNAGRINNTIKQAELNVAQAKANKESTKYDIVLQVANAYMNILFAKENLTNATAQRELTTKQKQNLERLISAGVRPTNDILELDAQLAQQDQSIVSIQNQVESAKLTLAQLLRMNEVPVGLASDNIGALIDVEQVTLADLEAAVFQNHPALKAAMLGIESAKIGEDIAEAGKYPSVNLGGNLNSNYSNNAKSLSGSELQTVSQNVVVNGTPVTLETQQAIPLFEDTPYGKQIKNNFSYGIGLGVNIPIFNGNRVNADIQRAKLNTMSQELSLTELQDNLRASLQNVLFEAQSAKQNYEGSTQALASQQMAFDNAEKKYNAGSSGSLEWVTAQNLLQQANVTLTRAKYEYYFKTKILEYYLNGINQ